MVIRAAMMQACYAVLQPLLRGLGNVTLEPKSGDSTHDGYSRRTPGLLFVPDNKSGSADQPAAQRAEPLRPGTDAEVIASAELQHLILSQTHSRRDGRT